MSIVGESNLPPKRKEKNMADTSTKKANKVTGHLEERYGLYRIILAWTDSAGNRQRKSVSTGLTVKGNKTRATEVMNEVKKEHEALLKNMPNTDGLLFADFMEEWLEAVKPSGAGRPKKSR